MKNKYTLNTKLADIARKHYHPYTFQVINNIFSRNSEITYLVIDTYLSKVKYGDILMSIQLAILLKNFVNIELVIIKKSTFGWFVKKDGMKCEVHDRTMLEVSNQLIHIASFLSNKAGLDLRIIESRQEAEDFYKRESNKILFKKAIDATIGLNNGQILLKNIMLLHQEVLTIMIELAFQTSKVKKNISSILIGDIISNEYKSNAGAYLATNYRFNQARPDKNGNARKLIESSRRLYEKWGLKTFVCTEREGRNEISSLASIPTDHIIVGKKIGLLYDLHAAINSVLFYQHQGGGITTPFVLSSKLNYVFMGSFPYISFSEDKLFRFSTSSQFYQNCEHFEQSKFDKVLDLKIQLALDSIKCVE